MRQKIQYSLLFSSLIAFIAPLCIYASFGDNINEFFHKYTWKTNIMDLWCMTIAWNLLSIVFSFYHRLWKLVLLFSTLIIVIFIVKASMYHRFDVKDILIYSILLLLSLITSCITIQKMKANENLSYTELKQNILDENNEQESLEEGKEHTKDHASFFRLIELGKKALIQSGLFDDSYS